MTGRIAKAAALVRRPVDDVFNAFVRPEEITRFWLQSASAPLAPGAKVHWEFMVPGASETATVTAFEAPRLIAFDWSDGLHVKLDFKVFSPDVTHVSVEVTGLRFKAGYRRDRECDRGFRDRAR
jgi:uncharacterized protein YndB with AHSA1/START domain